MRLSKSLYASGVLNDGKVIHCNEWDIGDYNAGNNTAARFVRNAQQRFNPVVENAPIKSPSRWKNFKNVLRIG